MKYTEMWSQKSSNKLLFLFVMLTLMLTACGDQKTVLETIRESGELRFVTVESPLTYFKSSDGTAEGLEYELARMFAQYLGLGLNLIVVGNKYDVVSLINNNKAHVGSSALALSDYPDNTLQYGPAYITAKRQLVYHQKNRKPKSIEYLTEDEIVIGEEQSSQALLETLSFYHPDLAWRAFLENIDKRFPNLRDLFRNSAREVELDWLLLAAVSYQESHWDPKAKSSTGVRGLMMLTIDTAKSLGIEDRLDPEQSILGGARYLAKMINKIPERIQDEDKIWFALAAYNVGFGHVEDAIILTQLQGGDPNKWAEVSKQLPLLEDENWHRKTVHGYARGAEPVKFVKNIRRYYDILKWKNAEIEKIAQQNRDRKNRAVPIINSPVL